MNVLFRSLLVGAYQVLLVLTGVRCFLCSWLLSCFSCCVVFAAVQYEAHWQRESFLRMEQNPCIYDCKHNDLKNRKLMGEVHDNIENKRGRMKMQKLCTSKNKIFIAS